MVDPTLPTPRLGGADWPMPRGRAPTKPAPRRRRARSIASTRGRGRGGWWLAVAVIAGLMAMHGFGTHGSHAAITSGEAHHAANVMVRHAPEPSLGSTTTTMSRVAETTLSSAGGALLEGAASPLTSDSGGSSLLGLCLALLTLGLIWFLSRATSRVVWTVPRMSPALGREALPATAHPPDPLSRSELCIWRC